MNIAVIGTGYVGLVAGVCFAERGNDVNCVDNDRTKIERPNPGKITIYEPVLSEILERNFKARRLSFTTDLPSAAKHSRVIFIAVGTPQVGGEVEMTHHILAVGSLRFADREGRIRRVLSLSLLGLTKHRQGCLHPGSDMIRLDAPRPTQQLSFDWGIGCHTPAAYPAPSRV